MGTVNIGGRELRVLGKDDPGGFRRDVDLARVGAEMAAANASNDRVEAFRKMAETIFCYVRNNEGVTLDWLIDALPADIGPALRACAKASGREEIAKGPASGEASRPETPH